MASALRRTAMSPRWSALVFLWSALPAYAGGQPGSEPAGNPASQPAEHGDSLDECDGHKSSAPAAPIPPAEASDPTKLPRWVCDKAGVTIDPVWAGKPATFSFLLRNGGGGDLQIRAKGG